MKEVQGPPWVKQNGRVKRPPFATFPFFGHKTVAETEQRRYR